MSQKQQRKQSWDNRKRAKSYNKRQKCCKLIFAELFIRSIINNFVRVSFKEKVKFSEDVRRLSDPALKDLVVWIREKCP